MPGRHNKSIHVNLEVEPQALSECAQQNPNYWFTLGDLHGNALKLLHFLKLHGAAQMGHVDDYERFVEIYNKKNKALTEDDIRDLQEIIARITITPTAHIRLLGDELCDRGSNDYFTLMLLDKLITGTKTSGKVEILLSNHSNGFIDCQENNIPYNESPLAHPYARDQDNSARNLQVLLNKKWIAKGRVDYLYTLYKQNLKAMSYEVNAQGEISSIYTHAPMGENDIFQMGQGIETYAAQQKTAYLFTDTHRTRIKALLNAIRARKNKNGIASRHLVELMDLINEIVAHNADQNTLSQLTNMGPELSSGQEDGYGLDASTHPFHMLLWNREPRHDKDINNKRTCPIHYVNGHDMGENNKNPQRNSHDNLLGKAPGFHQGPLGYSCTDSTDYSTAEPYTEIPEDPYSKISALSVPALGISMAAATPLGNPIALIPYTEGALLDSFILPYLTGKMAYWLNYTFRVFCDGKDADLKVIAKDSANLQWQITLGMGGMEVAKHVSEFLIYGLKDIGLNLTHTFFETTLSFSTKFIESCPIELKGALMLVSGLGFALGVTVAKWHQTHQKLQGMELFAELALTFCFGFIVGAAAAVGYKNEVAELLMPAATTAVLMMGVHHKWMPTAPELVTPAVQKNGDLQSSNRQVLGHTQT